MKRVGDDYLFPCPVCQEDDLTVWVDDEDVVLLNCPNGCNIADILAAVGLTIDDLRPKTLLDVATDRDCSVAIEAARWADFGHDDEEGPGAQTAPGAFRFWTPPELAAVSEPEPEAIVEGIAYRETITEVTAGPKVGKTTVLLALSRAVATGEPFAGRPTEKGPVVYLTEERRATFLAGLRRVGLDDHPDLHILLRVDAGKDWPAIVKRVREHARTVGAVLLVVDTLADWAGLKGDDENNSGHALTAMRPLQAAAADGPAVVVARHDRKGGGALGESGRGSNAFAGAVDVLIQLRRVDGQGHENRREIVAVGRFDDIPPTAVVEFNEGRFDYLGDMSSIERREAGKTILDHLPTAKEYAITETELLEAMNSTGWQGSRGTARNVLMSLVNEGRVQRERGAGTTTKRSFGYWEAETTVVC